VLPGGAETRYDAARVGRATAVLSPEAPVQGKSGKANRRDHRMQRTYMSNWRTLSKATTLSRILDESNCPVARMRLYSQGIQTNNRIYAYEAVTGDKGCLACGNCIDACPVVREKKRFVFVQNQRTSMALENIVGPECRRCYACIRTCPQVTKPVKEFSLGFRRAERFVHNYTAVLIITLAATGIFMFHFGEDISVWQQRALAVTHAFFGFFLLIAPLLYWLLDPAHLKRAIANSMRFGRQDLTWLKEFRNFIGRPQSHPLPCWTEFNTYHKFWFSYLLSVLPLLGLTGIINLMGESLVGPAWAAAGDWIHLSLAMITDLLILTHIYFKILRQVFRNMYDLSTYYQEKGSLHYPFSYDPKSASKSKL
jgi:cytochrome b subunit of formate dehydrogenase